MTTTSGRKFSLFVIAAIVVVLAGGLALSMFRRGAAPRRELEQRVAEEKDQQEKEAPPEEDTSGLPKPAAPQNDYVGHAACAECHAQIAESYASHSMAKSAAPMATAPPLEEFGEKATFAPDERHIYSVEKSDLGVNHHERRLDAEGKTIYDQSVHVDYSIGSGVHGRSYLIDREGSMYMSPISWYTTAHRWNLSPGYKLPVHRRFERRITTACLDCHVGKLNLKRSEHNHFGNPPFQELAIGCERCHGPGGQHVVFHKGGAAKGTDPIINPVKLDPARREDVCAQCHLQGDSRIANYGCEIGDFRPGQRLEETMAVFVRGTRTTEDGKSKAVSHVDQMRSSTCYKKSTGKFGCTSCHDPHSLPSEADKPAFYREKCLSCHQQKGCSVPETERRTRQANDSCVACHMQPLTASDIPHTSHTDHRVLRTPSTLAADPSNADELPDLYDDAASRIPQLALERARGLWLSDRAETRTDRKMAEVALTLLGPVSKRLPDDADVLDGLGTASAVAGHLDDALEYWKRALELEPSRDATLRTLALTLQNTQRVNEALPYLERYLQIQPWSASMWGRYSHMQGLAGNWTAALDAAKKTEAIDPSQPRVYQWLSEIHKQLGNEQESQRYQELFERIKP